jgi:hypothetical protein
VEEALVVDPAEVAEPITVEYTLTVGDVARAGMDAARHSMTAAAFGAFMIISGTLGAMFGDLVSILILLLGIGILTGLLPGAVMTVMVRRRAAAFLRPITLEIDGAGVTTTMPGSAGRTAWSLFRSVRVSGSTLLFDYGTGASFIAPRRAFDPGRLDLFRQLARAAGVLDERSALWPTVKGVALALVASVVLFALATGGMNPFG